MATLKITYTILDGNCGDLAENEIRQYASALESTIRAAYPHAEIDVTIKWHTSGIGGGASVREVEDGYEVDPDDCECDADEIETHIGDIAERAFETAGA